MATTVDELIVEIRAETQDLKKGLSEVERRVGSVKKSVDSSITSFKNLGRVFAAIGLANVAGQVVTTSRSFEDLEATLRAITGSSEKAADSMALIRKFTAGTTFQLQEVTSAFTTLLNAGISPTTTVLTDFGNVAAAFNKDITQLAQAAFNATTGEMEMLKQFGIIAKVEGDKLAVTFDGTTTKIERDAQSIIEFIRKIGSETFPTALEERADTVSGKFSNLADATTDLFIAIGEGGLNEGLKSVAGTLIDVNHGSMAFAATLGQILGKGLQLVNRAILKIEENSIQLLGVFAVFASAKLIAALATLATTFVTLARSVGILKLAMMALNKVSKKNIFVALAIGAAYFTGVLDEMGERTQEALEKLGKMMGLEPPDPDVLDPMAKSIEELNQSISEIKGGVVQLEVEGATMADIFDDMRESITSTTHSFTTDFVTGLMEGRNALESFKNFAKNIVAQIISTFLQMLVVNKILNSIFMSFGMPPLPTMGFEGGKLVDTTPPPKARGGPVTGRRPYLVGEKGPEIFVPHTSGGILSNRQSKSAVGGGGIVINQSLNFSTGVQATVRQEVVKMLPMIGDVSKASVLEAASRGGNFRKGLLGT